jgi:hypothetical protein
MGFGFDLKNSNHRTSMKKCHFTYFRTNSRRNSEETVNTAEFGGTLMSGLLFLGSSKANPPQKASNNIEQRRNNRHHQKRFNPRILETYKHECGHNCVFRHRGLSDCSLRSEIMSAPGNHSQIH